MGQTLALLHDYLSASAEQWPDLIAIEVPPGNGRDRQLTSYAELRTQSEDLAFALSSLVEPDTVVAILLSRDSANLYVAQLATLYAGGCFLSIEPSFPDEQIREILSDSRAVVLITDEAGRIRAASSGFPVVHIFDIGDNSQPETSLTRSPRLGPENLAYMIYTSGTTSRPKGVLIEHRSIVNLVHSDIDEFQLCPGDRVVQGSSAAYDSSIEECWLAWASGATLVIMDDETTRLGPDLVPWLRREGITVLCPPPTLLRTTGCQEPESDLPDLRLLYVGGEALTQDVADVWAKGRRLVNGYGPTECTVTCSRADIAIGDEIVIGRPVPGMTAWILDDQFQEVQDGLPGELCFSGVGVARGYNDRPDLTAAKFVNIPGLGRVYRTGDRAERRPDSSLSYLGRLDSQVKIRGYRIELEAIEAVLTQQAGIREAACRVQRIGGQDGLVGFVVPTGEDVEIDWAKIKSALGQKLPAYMVPARFARVGDLPRSVGGKLNREALPTIEINDIPIDDEERPANELEEAVLMAFKSTLGYEGEVSTRSDFFTDLGGSSLLAAKLVSIMREDPAVASVTVRDVYEARTIERLSQRLRERGVQQAAAPLVASVINPLGTTLGQSAFLLFELVVGSTLVVLGLEGLASPVGLILIGTAALFWPLIAVILAVAAKRLLIGRYSSRSEIVWGGFFLRNWIVQRIVRLVPWRLFEGSELACMALRALGARIGRGVHFHRGSLPLDGGWDLLDIGDGAILCQDAGLGLVELEASKVIVGPISIGDGATVGVRARIASGASLGKGSHLSPLSSLTPGSHTGTDEDWDGIPAQRSGPVASDRSGEPAGREMHPLTYAAAYSLARLVLSCVLAAPFGVAFVIALRWLDNDFGTLRTLGITACLAVAATPATLLLEAASARAMGRIAPGRIPMRSWGYIRVALKSNLVESAGRLLSGTLFWPVWLRLAGMKIGRDCEISTIIDVVPELVEIESECFLADGVYLGPPHLRRGAADLDKVTLSPNTFIGNHAVVPSGSKLPADILLGVCTVADQRQIRPGTSWFGLPPFELPRHDVREFDRTLTHAPGPVRYWNRVFWEALRFIVPVGPASATVGWMLAYRELSTHQSVAALALIGVPLSLLVIGLLMIAIGVLLKWILLGKVKPGTHPLWSCWCSRWDFHYVVWGEWTRPFLSSLEGTLLLNVVLRTLGMKIGRSVVLGSGFAQVVDPDMIRIGDGATVSAMFQAHTFEDRVLKIDRVDIEPHATLGFGTVPLYGAHIGRETIIEPHGVVMKHERLAAGRRYEGAPTHPVDGMGK